MHVIHMQGVGCNNVHTAWLGSSRNSGALLCSLVRTQLSAYKVVWWLVCCACCA